MLKIKSTFTSNNKFKTYNEKRLKISKFEKLHTAGAILVS